MHDELPELKSSYYPPRAGVLTPLVNRRRRLWNSVMGFVPAACAPVPWKRALLAVLVPGMGFEVYGRRLIGWMVFGAWTLGGLSTILLTSSSPMVFLLFQFDPFFVAVGLMVGMHSTSVSYFAQRYCGWEAPRQRLLMSIAVTGILLLGIYLPLIRTMDSYRYQGQVSAAGLRVTVAMPVEVTPHFIDRARG